MNMSTWFGGKGDEARAINAYNLGLTAKYEGKWEESLRQNQLADGLRPGDKATLWNLAIAATALSDWDTARRAWRACGIKTNDGPGEVSAYCGRSCVRLDPNGAAEVLWGARIDPARIRIENIPLAGSGRRYGDILINDGAQEGSRLSGGQEYPVFDDLGLWKVSVYSTYEVELIMPSGTAMESLENKCRDSDMWVEDWRTVRTLCAACSRSTPVEHKCESVESGRNKFGFASKSEVALRRLLRDWVEVEQGAQVGNVTLVVSGQSA